jgi:serine/threonine protein kinase HipA of HipAB toxin-antitoxin module
MATDDLKLIDFLLREDGRPHDARTIAREASVDYAYAKRALRRMAAWTPDDGDPAYPILARPDLGSDVYEAIEDSAREWTR